MCVYIYIYIFFFTIYYIIAVLLSICYTSFALADSDGLAPTSNPRGCPSRPCMVLGLPVAVATFVASGALDLSRSYLDSTWYCH